jgi:hypothetical protein
LNINLNIGTHSPRKNNFIDFGILVNIKFITCSIHHTESK